MIEGLITYVLFPVSSKIPEPPDAKFAPRRIVDLNLDILVIKERKGGGLLLYPKCLAATNTNTYMH